MISRRFHSPAKQIAFAVSLCLFALSSSTSFAACDGPPEDHSKPKNVEKTQSPPTPKLSFSQQLQHYFQSARDAGSTTASSAGHWLAEQYDYSSKNTSETTSAAMKWLTNQYNNAVASGETTAKTAQAWFAEDLGKIGSWEYRVLRTTSSDKRLEDELNELGRERWECFSTVSHGGRLIYSFKRQHRSYLQSVPAKELLRLVPLLDFSAEE